MWLSIISTKRWGKVSKYVLSWQWMDNIFIQSIMGTGFHINGHTSTALKIINHVLPAFQDPDRRFRMEMIRRHKPWNKRREQIQLNEAQVYFKCSTFHSKNTITDWEHDTILSYTEKCEESLIACLSFWQKNKTNKKTITVRPYIDRCLPVMTFKFNKTLESNVWGSQDIKNQVQIIAVNKLSFISH